MLVTYYSSEVSFLSNKCKRRVHHWVCKTKIVFPPMHFFVNISNGFICWLAPAQQGEIVFLQCLQLVFSFIALKNWESATNCLLLLCLSFSSPLSNIPLYSHSIICSLLLHCLIDDSDSTTLLLCPSQYP